VSYGELEILTARAAAGLRARGVAPGDRVALQVEKSVDAVVIYLAALKVGAVFLPLNAAYTPAEVDYFLRDAEPAIFLQDAQAFLREAADLEPDHGVEPRSASALAAIISTSGTTGRSKGAMLTHGALAANALPCTRPGASHRMTCCCTPCRSSTSTACSWPCTAPFSPAVRWSG